uniref:NADH dehydrogenase subunit 6 n=1 Tax=Panagrolaimus sp. JU765 TaxID=591449 RepID=A0AC34RT73_9BILA
MSSSSRKAYKSIFCSCWCLSLLLTIFVIFLLIKAIASPTVPPFYATCSLSLFIFLFVAASVSYVLFAVSERYGLAILTIIFIVAELICGLITILAIFVSPRYDPFILFSRAPIEWIQNHRWL